MGVSQCWGYLIRSPHNKDHIILGSVVGSPYFGKLPFVFAIYRPTYCKSPTHQGRMLGDQCCQRYLSWTANVAEGAATS